ncbi:MAG: 1-deoxy-D-xylulose-5-phosphate reductoisomerase [Thermodesulfobacteriota bacterium]
MSKTLSILGSTGSIGTATLAIVRQFPDRFQVAALAAGNNIHLLSEQIKEFKPQLVSVATPELAAELGQLLDPAWQGQVLHGREGNSKVACHSETDTVVSAIVGAAGLLPTLAAIKHGKDVALANKETLVMAGDLIMGAVAEHGVSLLPIDSEHNAIFQALDAGRRQDVHKIILTASGGPFRAKESEELWEVSPAQALDHPNWDMGAKISIDSATLMNKGLEVIEAKYLFNTELADIEVVIHPQSIVHSMVEFIDGSVISQMGIPDMRIPIAYALAHPGRLPVSLPRLGLTEMPPLTFQPPDFNRFPALELAYWACEQGGTLPAVLNGANEIAVASFLAEKIRFPEIARVVAATMERHARQELKSIATVLAADLWARQQAETVVEELQGQSP